MSATLRCPKCGHGIDRENPVCAGCGAKLKVKPLKLPDTPVIKIPKALARVSIFDPIFNFFQGDDSGVS